MNDVTMTKAIKILALFTLGIIFQSSISASQTISREVLLSNLTKKNTEKKPLVAHVLVALCDNDYQGIVPVPKKLGNGQDLRNNLYWGALYGVRTEFKRSANWFFKTSYKPSSSDILERVIFESTNKTGNKIILIADAYRGDRMKECLTDYFDYLGGTKKLELPDSLGFSDEVDLVVFNGHNGLMDTDIVMPKVKEGHKNLEAMAIGCASYDYFEPYWKKTESFPLLSTNNLMAPEGYILHAALDSWKELKSKEAVHVAAANAYNKYQHCGVNGAKRLFRTGWKE